MKKFFLVFIKIVAVWILITSVGGLLIGSLEISPTILGVIVILNTIFTPYFFIRKNYKRKTQQNSTLGVSDLSAKERLPIWKRFLKSVLRIFIAVVVIIIVFIGYVYFKSINTAEDILTEYFFEGDEKARDEYLELDKKYTIADSTGDYEVCLDIQDAVSRQFCLSLANKFEPREEICNLMDPSLHEGDSMWSQDGCFRSLNKNKSGNDEIGL